MNSSYNVAVKLSLNNQVSAGLLAMSGQFAKLQGQATALQVRLNSIRTLALTGMGLAAGGFFGLHLIEKALKPAEEYAHQLNIMTMANFKHKELVESIGDAWKNTGDVITSTATGNLRALLDMKNVLGDYQEARRTLPLVTKMQAVLESSTEGSALAHGKSFASDFAFSVAKSLDIVGAAKTKEDFEKQAILMSQVITAFQGRVTPRMFQSVFAYARQAKLPMDDEFKYRFLPTLMLEYAQGNQGAGGGSRGVGPMIAAIYRVTNQGYVNKKSLPLIQSLGLASKGDALTTTTTGTTLGRGLKGADLAARNPFEWTQEVLMPAIYKKFGNNLSQVQIARIINEVFRGNQLAAAGISEFALKPQNFLRDAKIISGAMTVDKAYQQALIGDPRLAREAVAAQWENVQTALTVPLVTVLIPALTQLATIFNTLAQVLIKYPTLAKALSYGLTALFGAMAVGGTILLVAAAFKGLALGLEILSIPLMVLGAPILGIAAGLALVGYGAYKLWNMLKEINWDPIVQKFKQLWVTLQNSPLGLVINAFKTLFSLLSSGISSVINGIKGLVGIKGGVDAQLKGLDGKKGGYNVYQSNPGSGITDFSPKGFNPVGSPQASNKRVNSTIQVASNIHLDGRVIARVVTDHQINDALRTPNYTQGFDPSMAPTPMVLKGNVA